MEREIKELPSKSKVLRTAYSIFVNVFKRKISVRESKENKSIKYLSLSGPDKAKCNDLVQKALRHTLQFDQWINTVKKGRMRVELLCMLRLALTDILLKKTKKKVTLAKYSDLVFSLERTRHSKDQLRYYIHLAYSDFEKKKLKPVFLIEKEIREALVKQYGCKNLKNIELILSKPPAQDFTVKNHISLKNYFSDFNGLSVHSSHFRLFQNVSLRETKGYHSGDWWVQSLSASLPVELAPFCLKGKNILDVCCAPGGKSFQLVDRGAHVTSIDKSKRRVKLMRENLDRLNFDLKLICSDVFDYNPNFFFDVILLDPPCTATGTIGKNPDLQFLSPLERLNDLLEIQKKMLQRCSNWISDKGYIIYSVCSLLKEEGEFQIDNFLKKNKNFKKVFPKRNERYDQPGFKIDKTGGTRIMPFFESNSGGTEGFYIAYLQINGKNR